jgi:hypothetical protein
MNNDNETKYLQIFSLTDLISAPLIATVEGDFYAAERFVTYLRKYGFEPPDVGKPWDFGKLRMVVFQYRTMDGWMEMQIPLISLIPLPLLSVSDASFEYNLKILGLISPAGPNPTSSRDPKSLMQRPLGESVEPKKIMGTFAPLRRQTEAQEETPTFVANMDIKIQMRQSDLPAGIAAMLNVVQSAVEGTTRGRIRLDPDVSALTQNDPVADLRVMVLDRDNQPLRNYLFKIAATPRESAAHLREPEVVEGTLVSRVGEFELSALTSAEGVAVIRWERGKAPKVQTDVTVTAIAEVDFPGNQFGPTSVTALLQILPSDPMLARFK